MIPGVKKPSLEAYNGISEPAPLKSKWEMNFKERELDKKITKEKKESKRL
jgi:hypothetical protein